MKDLCRVVRGILLHTHPGILLGVPLVPHFRGANHPMKLHGGACSLMKLAYKLISAWHSIYGLYRCSREHLLCLGTGNFP